jgi:hypothetical protein
MALDRLTDLLFGRTAKGLKSLTINAIAKYTVDPGNKTGYTKTISIQIDPQKGFEIGIRVPADETWIITDLYITSEPAVDSIITMVKNDKEKIFQSAPLSTYNYANPSRSRISPKVLKSNETLTLIAQLLSDYTGTSAVDVSFYLTIERYYP